MLTIRDAINDPRRTAPQFRGHATWQAQPHAPDLSRNVVHPLERDQTFRER
jgi:hypothetical protein